jgi:glycogen debranching enzyme
MCRCIELNVTIWNVAIWNVAELTDSQVRDRRSLQKSPQDEEAGVGAGHQEAGVGPGHQPYLHDLVVCLAAPTVLLSDPDGQIRPLGAQGVLHADIRVLSRAEVRVGGHEAVPVAHGVGAAGDAEFVALVRSLGDEGPDPTVRLERRRRVRPGRLDERLRLVSAAAEPISTHVTLTLAADLAPIHAVKNGDSQPPARPVLRAAGAEWRHETTRILVSTDDPVVVTGHDDGHVTLQWDVHVEPCEDVTVSWSLQVRDAGAIVVAAPVALSWQAPCIRAEDRRLERLVARSLDDLNALRMVTSDRPDEVFLGAGAPWYLTLFGRDSLWAARMLLPLTTGVAASTLRLLAEHQGQRVDPDTGEAPGKIPHEMRRASAEHAGGVHLPALYFGTVDATALWICLLHDAWRWGLARHEVEALAPALEAALGWLRAQADRDGFLQYVDESGRGLANQGWKDSGDAVRFADGTRALPPIALCEVQGYAYEAAISGARLLDLLDRPGGEEWRGWAAALASRFRQRFWVEDEAGRFPALSLDGADRKVDSLTSNIGHLLGTGLLDAHESDLVAAAVTGADMDGGFGLRTMSERMAGFQPLSYHCGSVWPHDTAIVVHGLVRAGQSARVSSLVAGLLAAGEAFDYRLPELYSGDDASAPARPVPYPAACRPQAWSSAASVVLLQAVLGLEVDVPAGRISLRPPRPSPVGALRVEGLRIGNDTVTVELDAAGKVLEVSGTSLHVDTD